MQAATGCRDATDIVWFCKKQQVTLNNVLELRVGSWTAGQLQTQTIDV
jgi:hypothetical protein